MNCRKHPEAACGGVGGRVTRLWWSGLLALGVTGCVTDHRISLSQFLETQQAMAPEEGAESVAHDIPTIDVDRHLRPYAVGPSDVLSVSLAGPAQMGLPPVLQVRVNREGTIDLPLAGAVKVADLELEDVEKAIRNAYVPGVYQQVAVHAQLVEVDTTSVLVVGAVTEPGLVGLRRNERNLLFGIVGAGGVSELASGHTTLRRIRRPDEESTFDLRDPAELQQVLALDPLEDGDIVYVHAAQPNTVFVGGLVHRIGPQSYPLNTEVTVLQALAAAGGVRTDVFPREGTLIRRGSDGTDVHVRFNLGRLARGEEPNIALAAGDIVWVPDTWDTRVEDFINRNIFVRAGVSVSYNVTGIEFMNRHRQQSGQMGGSQQDVSDPYGFLRQNSALEGLQSSVAPLQP